MFRISLNPVTVRIAETVSEVQVIDGKEVRLWYLNFTPEETGTYVYTVTVNNLRSESVEITVK